MKDLNHHNDYHQFTITKLIISKLLASYKLIIAISIIATFLAFIYYSSIENLYRSSVTIKIANSKLGSIPNKVIHLESSRELVNGLLLDTKYNSNKSFLDRVVFKSNEYDNSIDISTTSKSIEDNISAIKKASNYIFARHENMVTGAINSNEKKLSKLDSKIYNLVLRVASKKKYELNKIEKNINLAEKIILDTQLNLELLKLKPELYLQRASVYPTLEDVIYSHESDLNSLKFKRKIIVDELQILSSYKNDNEVLNVDLDQEFDNLNKLILEKSKLENESLIAEKMTQNKSHYINEVKTETLRPSRNIILFFGLMIGLLSSFFIIVTPIGIQEIKQSLNE